MKPCGSCLRAEFADDESDDLRYVAASSATTAHIKRPANSMLRGGAWSVLIQSHRTGERTYCGLAITDSWTEVTP